MFLSSLYCIYCASWILNRPDQCIRLNVHCSAHTCNLQSQYTEGSQTHWIVNPKDDIVLALIRLRMMISIHKLTYLWPLAWVSGPVFQHQKVRMWNEPANNDIHLNKKCIYCTWILSKFTRICHTPPGKLCLGYPGHCLTLKFEIKERHFTVTGFQCWWFWNAPLHPPHLLHHHRHLHLATWGCALVELYPPGCQAPWTEISRPWGCYDLTHGWHLQFPGSRIREKQWVHGKYIWHFLIFGSATNYFEKS